MAAILPFQTFGPIAGAALRVSNCDDLDIVRALAENDKIRKSVEENAAGAVQERRAGIWSFAQARKSGFELISEIQRRRSTSTPIEVNRFPGFGLGFRVIFECLHALRLLAICASRSARNSSCETILTAPESISSRRRLISSSQADSTSAAETRSSSIS